MGEDNKLLLVFKTLLEKYNSLVEEGYVLDTKVKLIKRGEEEKEVRKKGLKGLVSRRIVVFKRKKKERKIGRMKERKQFSFL